MADNNTIPTQDEIALDWIRFTIERLQKAIVKAGIKL